MGKKHYHVLTGLGGGYMPSSNEVYETKADALRGAREMKGIFQNDPETKVKGRAGFYTVGNEYIEVTECTEGDCLSHRDSLF
jgi:hypothetical protein